MDTKSEIKMSQCPYCGNAGFDEKRVNYLYGHAGKFLLVPNTPAEVCQNCGMEFYAGAVVLEIEKHFFAIHEHKEAPDTILEIPCKAFV